MGMFDTIYAELHCPDCEAVSLQEVQTKRFECALSRYTLGDVIDKAPPGDVWLEEEWQCEACLEQRGDRAEVPWRPVYVHLVDGFVFEISQEDTRGVATDKEKLLAALQAAAVRAMEYKWRMGIWYHWIENARAFWQEPPRRGDPLYELHRETTPRDNEALVERLYRDLSEVLDEATKKEW